LCPSVSQGSVAKRAAPFKQPQLQTPTGIVLPACDTDFYDGSPKIWRQSQKFFSDDYTMYHLERKSATQLQEDTKIWLEALARKSRLARDRFNQKNLNGHHNLSTLDSGEELLESVAPLRLNTTRAKPLPFARKSGS
jgi:hypothetical protein